MPSIRSNLFDDPLLNITGATVGDQNDDKNKTEALKATFNSADAFVRYSIDLNSGFIDTVIANLEWVLKELEKQQEEQVFDHAGIFEEFKTSLNAGFAEFYNLYLATEQNLQACMNAVKQFADTSEANSYEHYINDSHKTTVNEMIATHLYRQGLFDVAEMFVVEAGVEELTDKVTGLVLKQQFKILHVIISALKDHETELPLMWIAENREMLGDTKASELEYKIHVNKYIGIMEKPGPLIEVRMEALSYAKFHLSRFVNGHNRDEISKVFGWLMLQSSELHSVADPHYLGIFDGSYKQNLIAEIEELFYIMMGQCMGQCVKDPLSTVTSVGAKCLSGVCKAAKILKESRHRCGWAKLGILPLYQINLDEELKFHSQFACPRIKHYMVNGFNPPVALACGHVLSFKLSLCHTVSPFGFIICPFCFVFTAKDSYKTVKF